MGSIFATIPGNSIKGFLGKEQDVPFYLQFVPGYVVDIVTSMSSVRAAGDTRNINSIIKLDSPNKIRKAFYINPFELNLEDFDIDTQCKIVYEDVKKYFWSWRFI